MYCSAARASRTALGGYGMVLASRRAQHAVAHALQVEAQHHVAARRELARELHVEAVGPHVDAPNPALHSTIAGQPRAVAPGAFGAARDPREVPVRSECAAMLLDRDGAPVDRARDRAGGSSISRACAAAASASLASECTVSQSTMRASVSSGRR
jgi:hypothetical protein